MSDELRSLDAEVHRRIFNKPTRWLATTAGELIEDPTSPFGFTCDFGGAEYGADREWHSEDWYDDEARLAVPAYSSSWDAVQPVVAWLRSKRTNLGIHAANGWSCSVWNIHDSEYYEVHPGPYLERDSVSENGDTMPEAVCHCALLVAQQEST